MEEKVLVFKYITVKFGESEEDRKNGVIHAKAHTGRKVDREILPEALETLHQLGANKLVFDIDDGINGVKLELFGGETLDKAVEDYYKQKKMVFSSLDEAMLALAKIKPADLSSSETTKEDAMNLCKDVMTVILKCRYISDNFKNVETRKIFQKSLRDLGCVEYEQANEKFFELGKNVTEGRSVYAGCSIEFPLHCFSRLLKDEGGNSFVDEMKKLTEGLERSSIGSWLTVQDFLSVFNKHEGSFSQEGGRPLQ